MSAAVGGTAARGRLGMGSSQILTRGEAAVKYTRFEKARIIGARALQISMGAPTLLELEKGVVDPIRIAEAEFEAGVIPITVRRELGPPA